MVYGTRVDPQQSVISILVTYVTHSRVRVTRHSCENLILNFSDALCILLIVFYSSCQKHHAATHELLKHSTGIDRTCSTLTSVQN